MSQLKDQELLVLEDDEDLRGLIRCIAESAGMHVSEAATVAQAFEPPRDTMILAGEIVGRNRGPIIVTKDTPYFVPLGDNGCERVENKVLPEGKRLKLGDTTPPQLDGIDITCRGRSMLPLTPPRKVFFNYKILGNIEGPDSGASSDSVWLDTPARVTKQVRSEYREIEATDYNTDFARGHIEDEVLKRRADARGAQRVG